MMRAKIAVILVGSMILVGGIHATSGSAASAPSSRCTLNASGGLLGGSEGILIQGNCVPVSGFGGTEDRAAEYRYVGCMPGGAAVSQGGALADTRCAGSVPRCKLLAEGGQSGPSPAIAYETQVRQPGQARWTNLGFWCPQSQRATAVPDAATIRDQVLKLLPRVAIATTGSPATLVNLQTILWADTTARRSLGRITIVGQPVWLKIAFAHAHWDFGDGTSEASADPGKAYDATGNPCAQIMCPDYYGHVYRATGQVRISLTVSWQATYSLDGTHFVPVDPDPLDGPAATHALLVRQARAVLVPNPDGD